MLAFLLFIKVKNETFKEKRVIKKMAMELFWDLENFHTFHHSKLCRMGIQMNGLDDTKSLADTFEGQ